MSTKKLQSAMLEILAELNSDKPIPQDDYLRDKILGLQLLIEPQIDPRTDLKAKYAHDIEKCKTISGLEAWQLWQFLDPLESVKWFELPCQHKSINDIFDTFWKYRRHPHADNIIAYHKCSERDKKRWQRRSYGGLWHDCDTAPDWTDDEYRIKPETITINGKEYAAPLRVAPELGTKYFWYSSICGVKNDIWGNDPVDNQRLAANMVFATEQDCKAVADAFNAILRGYDND